MGSELLKASAGVEVDLKYPDSIPASLIRAVAVPAAVQVVAELAKSGIVATSVIVEAVELTKLKISYYREYARVIREDVIPVAAMNDAYQRGRNMIKAMGLDDDLLSDASEDLETKRQARRRRL
jgi:hypothetical protein